MVATQAKEFTLPFVGREEELQFLLGEYDHMLHAQYRSVWIEAPAGVGKTTLVEEFLRRIDISSRVQRDDRSPLKPWIVHAHLRERSSNSLASLVEALGITLQALTTKQQEALFGNLTLFYQERARKIVAGESVQGMGMEETMSTVGYILKQLSKHFPLVVIIEDLHLLKGEVSFYALRNLQAILEHVPLMMVYISRPSEEKYFRQYQQQAIEERCTKCELESLRYEEVEKLIGAHGDAPDAKELFRLSGGNALLLRELLRSDSTRDALVSTDSTTNSIVEYLKKELEKLPKKDKQVLQIAGVLGEEFSEQLLEEIASTKDFNCWSQRILERLESAGIIERRKKILKQEGEKKGVSLSVSVFSHALWWEAARKLYEQEKKNNKWTDKKLAEVITPLLSHEDYPLLTDAELIVNLLQWVQRKQILTILAYVDILCNVESRWNFHSLEERAAILIEAQKNILTLLRWKQFSLGKESMLLMVKLLGAGMLASGPVYRKEIGIAEPREIISELYSKFLFDSDILREKALSLYDEAMVACVFTLDKTLAKKKYNDIASLGKYFLSGDAKENKEFYKALMSGLTAGKAFYNSPVKALDALYRAASHASYEKESQHSLPFVYLFYATRFHYYNQSQLGRHLVLAKSFLGDLSIDTFPKFLRGYKIVLNLELLHGDVESALVLSKALEEYPRDSMSAQQHADLVKIFLLVYAYAADATKANIFLEEFLSHDYPGRDSLSCFKATAQSLFLLEEYERFEELWQTHQEILFTESVPSALPIVYYRVLCCLLSARNDEAGSAMKTFVPIVARYPELKSSVVFFKARLEKLFALSKKSCAEAKKDFKKVLTLDETFSPFDKAFYAQLFARIGVRQGHPPKEFQEFVASSLVSFEKLGLEKRVVFTAKKFFEEGLLTEKELEKILRKHNKKETGTIVDEKIITTNEQGDTGKVVGKEHQLMISCFGPMRVIKADGEEILSRRWGKRKSVPSHHKQIVAELICANSEHRVLLRKELLAALFPEARNGIASKKKLAKLDRILSVRLSQLKKSFAPCEIFEKTGDGFRLHFSVETDLARAKEYVGKSKLFQGQHLPSSFWCARQARNIFSGGEFCEGLRGKSIVKVRSELRELLSLSKK